MGVTIGYKLAQEIGYTKNMLDNAEKYAEILQKNEAQKIGIPFKIARHKDTVLFMDIGRCETLAFDFRPLAEWKAEHEKVGWSYKWETLKNYEPMDTTGDHYKKYPEQIYLWCSQFCKTQFADNIIEHKWVADIVRCVAMRCRIADVYDEGNYYHTGKLKDAENSIVENGAIIDSIGKVFSKLGYDKAQIVAGKTGIKKLVMDSTGEDVRDILGNDYKQYKNF